MGNAVNPYAPPAALEIEPPRPPALDRLKGPSIGLMVLSGITIVFGLFYMLGLVMIVGATLYNFGIAPFTGARIPISRGDDWWIALLGTICGVANAAIFHGARCMRQGIGYRPAIIAAVLACIPVASPILYLGIPFGIWALIVLRWPAVRAAFQS